jgi:hypothetical protein
VLVYRERDIEVDDESTDVGDLGVKKLEFSGSVIELSALTSFQ